MTFTTKNNKIITDTEYRTHHEVGGGNDGSILTIWQSPKAENGDINALITLSLVPRFGEISLEKRWIPLSFSFLC